jgi:hypothetical protein
MISPGTLGHSTDAYLAEQRLYGEEDTSWYRAAGLYSIRGVRLAAFLEGRAKPALPNLELFSKLDASRRAGVADRPPPSAEPIISRVLYTLG